MKKIIHTLLITGILMCNTAFSLDLGLPAPVVSPLPCDTKARPCAQRLMKFLADNYGRHIIAGQMDLTWNDGTDMAERVYRDTGKYPALMGYDLMNAQAKSGSGLKQIDEAAAWWNKGGIIQLMYHWRDPTGRNKETGGFYTKDTNFRIPYDVDAEKWKSAENGYENHAAYDAMMRDMDFMAGQLSILQDKDIPVLWRPLHEAGGSWFWWGASGSKAYIALYRLMFTYFTQIKKLHNLLWVWNAQDKTWYPGDDCVDIIGDDIYTSPKFYGSQFADYYKFSKMCRDPEKNPKIVALSECGVIPSPGQMKDDGAWWSWFMVWNDANGREGADSKDSFWTGEYYNDNQHKKDVYNSSYVITLDKMPDLKTYK
jgi:mannan endo-1,4-beta-mannosidase